jgi:hypothetical protein
LNLYPEAGEAGGCFVPTLRGRRSAGGGEADPERSRDEAARRAYAKVRRYAAANRLSRFWTLTYAGEGCFDHEQIRADLAEFFRDLRRALGCAPFPYVWVPELHPGGHGLHAHFVVGRFVPRGVIKDVWGRGIVHGKLIGNLPVGSGALEEARIAARYLGKYLSKSFGDERLAGLHRYEVAQGFQPTKVPLRGVSYEDVIAQASALMDRAPSYVWFSPEEGWHGPPAYSAQWSA